MTRRGLFLLAGLLLLLGCSGTVSGPPTCPDTDGAAVLSTRCLSCHSVSAVGRARGGAPEGVDFDTELDVRRWSDRIRATAVVNETMPPAALLPTCEATGLDDYLTALAAAPCTPSCTGRTCGSDGCGGSCGSCTALENCAPTGQCVAGTSCTRSCVGKACGSDGCGGSCGTCATGTTCSAGGQCTCVASCTGKQCGSDGCGGTCGTCPGALFCNTRAGSCSATCTPDCTGRVCGDDGCGGTCGPCAAGQACTAAGQCGCAPSCTGKQCGSDGCGGTCGTCSGGTSCDAAGACVVVPKSYAADVHPLWTRQGCAGGQCHDATQPAGGLDLSTAAKGYAAMVNVGSAAAACNGRTLVVPNDVAASYLVNKLTGTGMCAGSAMPKAGGLLSQADLNTVQAWILSNAAP